MIWQSYSQCGHRATVAAPLSFSTGILETGRTVLVALHRKQNRTTSRRRELEGVKLLHDLLIHAVVKLSCFVSDVVP